MNVDFASFSRSSTLLFFRRPVVILLPPVPSLLFFPVHPISFFFIALRVRIVLIIVLLRCVAAHRSRQLSPLVVFFCRLFSPTCYSRSGFHVWVMLITWASHAPGNGKDRAGGGVQPPHMLVPEARFAVHKYTMGLACFRGACAIIGGGRRRRAQLAGYCDSD